VDPLVTIPGLRCPVCHGGLTGGAAPLVACSGCLIVAHAECVPHRCPTLGCRGAPTRPLCRAWPWTARLGLVAIAPAVVVAALILREFVLAWSYYSQPVVGIGSLRTISCNDLVVSRAVVQADGRLHVDGGGELSSDFGLCVNDVQASVHHHPCGGESSWSVELPLDGDRSLQGEWVTLHLSAWAGNTSWSSRQTVPVVDSRAFDPARTDGVRRDR